jgi:hypothetical protein
MVSKVIAPPPWADSWREVLHIAFNVAAAVLVIAAIVLVGVFDVVGIWLVVVALVVGFTCALVNHRANAGAGGDFPDY